MTLTGIAAAPWTSQAHAQRILEGFASPLVGIVPRLYEKLRDVDDVYCYATGAQACDATAIIGAPCNAFNGGGSIDRVSARLAAIGETVERYSASWIPEESLRLATYAELTAAGSVAISPADLRLFSADQMARKGFHYTAFTEHTPIWWREGHHLSTGVPTRVPARLIHLSSRFPAGDQAIGYATSSGLACGISPDEAIIGGLFELIERDAFMQVWYAGLSMPQLDPESDPLTAEFLRRYAIPSGITLHLLDLTVFAGVPTVLAVTANTATDVAPIALGAASAATIREAALKAAVESFQTRSWTKAEQREGNTLNLTENFHGKLADFSDHIRLYAGGPLVERLDFLTANPERVSMADHPEFPARRPADLLGALVGHLDAQDIDVVAVDMTSPDVASGGAQVFRVFSPQLQPLDVGYDGRYLGGRRLRERPFELGLVPAPLTDADLNPLPHPFP